MAKTRYLSLQRARRDPHRQRCRTADCPSRHARIEGGLRHHAVEPPFAAQGAGTLWRRQSPGIDFQADRRHGPDREGQPRLFDLGRRGAASREVRESERSLEVAVSKVIGEMPFLWLAITDEPGPTSLRGYIERNAIALLSNCARQPIDPPSPSWLGLHCSRQKVRDSGLWNSNHVTERYDPAFLDTLADMISRAETTQ